MGTASVDGWMRKVGDRAECLCSSESEFRLGTDDWANEVDRNGRTCIHRASIRQQHLQHSISSSVTLSCCILTSPWSMLSVFRRHIAFVQAAEHRPADLRRFRLRLLRRCQHLHRFTLKYLIFHRKTKIDFWQIIVSLSCVCVCVCDVKCICSPFPACYPNLSFFFSFMSTYNAILPHSPAPNY